jgi:hypothetical protein
MVSWWKRTWFHASVLAASLVGMGVVAGMWWVNGVFDTTSFLCCLVAASASGIGLAPYHVTLFPVLASWFVIGILRPPLTEQSPVLFMLVTVVTSVCVFRNWVELLERYG